MRDDSGYNHLDLRLSDCVDTYWLMVICMYCYVVYRDPRDLIAAHGDMPVREFGRRLVCRRCRKPLPNINLVRMTDTGRSADER